MAAPATFVCLHGAGGHASYWDMVADELRTHGHEVVAVTLPSDQEVGLQAYVDATLDVIGDRRDNVVLVAQSLAGFIAPLVADVTPVELMVLVAAMVPAPGETGGEWWGVLDHASAVAAQGLPDDSPETLFVHDVPADVLARVHEPATRHRPCSPNPGHSRPGPTSTRGSWPVPTTASSRSTG